MYVYIRLTPNTKWLDNKNDLTSWLAGIIENDDRALLQ